MNIRGGSKNRINIKKEELKKELSKSEEERNYPKIKRLKKSIRRNKNISYMVNKKKRVIKQIKNKKSSGHQKV